MTKKRIAICRFEHEANTFTLLEAGLEQFQNTVGGILLGDELLHQTERSDEITGFLKILGSSEEAIEIVPLISASGFAGGNVTAEVVSYLEENLRRMLRETGDLDGFLFAMHGAMASKEIFDLEGYFLGIVREVLGDDIPLVCTLDHHAILTQRMVDLTDVIVAYRTHPHIDVVETGERGANILLRILAGEIKPVMEMKKIPIIIPPPDDGTNSGTLKELFDQLTVYEAKPGVITCSLCVSFGWQDVPEFGWATVAVTDNDKTLATEIVRDHATRVWESREGVLPDAMLPSDDAVQAASQAEGSPVLITDSADTIGGGAPGDTTALLNSLVEQRHNVKGLILSHLPDRDAVEKINEDDIGSTVTLEVGGKRDTRFSEPLSVTGEVLCVTDGIIEDVGKFTPTPTVDAGKTVCLGIDNIRLVLTERIIIGPQPSIFRKVGIEPFEAKIVALKTGVGFIPTYGHVAKAVIRSDCPGATSYNMNNYDFVHIPRPIYPLEPEMEWSVDEPGSKIQDA